MPRMSMTVNGAKLSRTISGWVVRMGWIDVFLRRDGDGWVASTRTGRLASAPTLSAVITAAHRSLNR